jgi:hypothetical protein
MNMTLLICIAGKAFCEGHCEGIEKLGYPSDLRAFIKSCGDINHPINANDYTKPMKERVDAVVKQVSKMMESGGDFRSSSDAQGRHHL